MRLEKLTAVPDPGGHRIDLSWEKPDPATYSGVRVMRREGTWPTSPDPATGGGRVVADTAAGLHRVADAGGLRGETVYYYALFPYAGDPPVYETDLHNRAAAMATGRYDFAERMYRLLPGIYHRYDTSRPGDVLAPERIAGMAAEDLQRGQLRRFLDLPGGKLDQLYSFARALRHLYDLDRVDGRLLRLLAQWIGWETDFRLAPDAQRNEIKNAPALYHAVGLMPTVAATVQRVSGWPSRSQELVHNIFLSNRPERLNLWLARRDATGAWSQDGDALSLNDAYEGRPVAARDQGVLHLLFHTRRKGGWAIWRKSYSPAGGWTPSRPLIDRGGIDKNPAVVFESHVPWVFWNAWDREVRRWGIELRTVDGSGKPQVVDSDPFGGESMERLSPVVAAAAGGFWLFWLERPLESGGPWGLRFNAHAGGVWGTPESFPADGGRDPGVDGDVFVLAAAGAAGVFWARRRPIAGGQTRWSICYRVRGTTGSWSAVRELGKVAGADWHEREPAVRLDAGGDLEVFYAANRDGGWSIWRNVLGISGTDLTDVASHTWNPAAAQAITGPSGPLAAQDVGKLYSQRCPLPVDDGDELMVIHRSNRCVTYGSRVYSALSTRDNRYAGCTTADARNAGKLALRGEYGEFQTYTYDTGSGPGARYRRDTLAIYLEPDSVDPEEIERVVARLGPVLREFMPATDRAVLITPEDG